MGGAKKPTAANKDKSAGKETKKSKKDKGESGPKKAEITVIVNEQQAMKIINNSKVVTVQDLARQIGVKISAANAFLKDAAKKGTVKKVGGYSGHHLYQKVSS
ncbi:MarR family transcriptional regulator [Nitrosopumilus sp. S4]